MGDGLMAMFGAPVSHEDHAVRACHAALAMLESVRAYAEEARRMHGAAIQIRVGLNSGEVIVRLISDDLHMDYTAMGQTVHLASRMEGLANAGAALLSPSILALVEGFVEARSLGPTPVKGLDQPIEVYELVGAGTARTRFQASAARGLTPIGLTSTSSGWPIMPSQPRTGRLRCRTVSRPATRRLRVPPTAKPPATSSARLERSGTWTTRTVISARPSTCA
jgi:hypothetical protein